MHRFIQDTACQITGQNTSARSTRLVQRAMAVGALVLMITALGPIFGYGLMAILGVFVMLVISPEKRTKKER